MTQPWPHVRRKAAAICEPFAIRDSTREWLHDNPTAPQFLERLIEGGAFDEAVPFMAFALPGRQGVWWGCLCLELARGQDLSEREARALEAAVRWVVDPTEAHRQAANEPADRAGLTTPAGNLAKAAFWSGGSMLPPGQPIVAPLPTLRPQAVWRAITGLVGHATATNRDAIFPQFLAIAAGIAADRYHWPKL